jgi:hypothetical protein
VPPDAVCIQCGYRLIGLPQSRCPECGRGFDPDDRGTYHVPGDARSTLVATLRRGWKRFVAAWFAPPSVPYLIVLAVVASSWTWHSSSWNGLRESLSADSDRQLWRLAGWLILLELTLRATVGVLAMCVGGRRPATPDGPSPRRRAAHWCAAVMLALLFVLMSARPWGALRHLRSALPEFQKVAEDYLAMRDLHPGSRRIGSFEVTRLFGRGQGYVFFAFGRGSGDTWGLVYDPHGLFPRRLGYELGGPWKLGRW